MKLLDAIIKGLRQSWGRKFLLVILTLFIASILVWYLKISDGIYRDIIFVVIGGYVAANVAQKAVEKKGNKDEEN